MLYCITPFVKSKFSNFSIFACRPVVTFNSVVAAFFAVLGTFHENYQVNDREKTCNYSSFFQVPLDFALRINAVESKAV